MDRVRLRAGRNAFAGASLRVYPRSRSRRGDGAHLRVRPHARAWLDRSRHSRAGPGKRHARPSDRTSLRGGRRAIACGKIFPKRRPLCARGLRQRGVARERVRRTRPVRRKRTVAAGAAVRPRRSSRTKSGAHRRYGTTAQRCAATRDARRWRRADRSRARPALRGIRDGCGGPQGSLGSSLGARRSFRTGSADACQRSRETRLSRRRLRPPRARLRCAWRKGRNAPATPRRR